MVEECIKLIEDFTLSLKMFTKFNEIWEKLQIKDRTLIKDCEGKIKKMAWLLFIIVKGKRFDTMINVSLCM